MFMFGDASGNAGWLGASPSRPRPAHPRVHPAAPLASRCRCGHPHVQAHSAADTDGWHNPAYSVPTFPPYSAPSVARTHPAQPSEPAFHPDPEPQRRHPHAAPRKPRLGKNKRCSRGARDAPISTARCETLVAPADVDTAARTLTQFVRRVAAKRAAGTVCNALRQLRRIDGTISQATRDYRQRTCADAKAALVYEEALTKAILATDGVESGGSDVVRMRRKATVKRAQTLLAQLEDEGQSIPVDGSGVAYESSASASGDEELPDVSECV